MSTTCNQAAGDEAGEKFIPLSEPCLAGNEWKYVRECLDTGWVSTAGCYVSRFEEEVARYVGARHAVATINGTAALHMALLASGVGPEDEVLVSTLTFIASANAVRYVGAHPVLIDADPTDWQIDLNLVAEFLQNDCVVRQGRLTNRVTGRRVAAIMPVHILGHPVRLDSLYQLAQEFGLTVVEDGAEALGARFQGKRVGGTGATTCFSFNGNKTMTTGAGGMIVTDDEQLAARARYLTTQAKDDPVEYIHGEVGYNFRMPNLLAAVGVAQLERLDELIACRRAVATRYQQELAGIGFSWLREADDAFATYWLATARVEEEACGCNARQLRASLQASGIQTRRLWRPIHENGPYRNAPALLTGVASDLADNTLSFPSSATLTSVDQSRVIKTTQQLLNASGPRFRAQAS